MQSTTVSEEDLNCLSVLSAAIQPFRDLTSHGETLIPTTLISAFLLVGSKPGQTVTALASADRTNHSKMSRVIADLSNVNRYGAQGYGLVDLRYDEAGPRTTTVYLSERGKALVRNIARNMKQRANARRMAA